MTQAVPSPASRSSQNSVKRGNSSGVGSPVSMASAARREAVLVVGARRAEIGGAEKRQPVRLEAGRHDAEAGEARALGHLSGRAAGGTVEEARAVDDLARLRAVNDDGS